MYSPTLYNVDAFNADNPFTFTFDWRGDQAFGSILTIKNNSTGVTVTTNTVTSMKLENLLPANTLSNGTRYIATIEVVDSNGTVISESSNSILFYCYSDPTFEFTNVEENQVIGNSSYQVGIAYSQDEGESLMEYSVDLYDMSYTKIYSSGVKYASGDDVELTVTISGFTDNSVYYLRATGSTQHHIILDTGYVKVAVDYINPLVFAPMTAENIADKGYVTLTSHVISVEGTGSDNLQYIDDSKVDLTVQNSYVKFENVEVDGNWRIELICSAITANKPIINISDGTHIAVVTPRVGRYLSQSNNEMCFFELSVDSASGHATFLSNYVLPPATDEREYHIWLVRIDGVYGIYAQTNSAKFRDYYGMLFSNMSNYTWMELMEGVK